MAKHEPSTTDGASWLLLALLVAAIVALQLAVPFTFKWDSLKPPLALAAILGIAAAAYARWRPKPEMIAMLIGIMQLCLFCSLGAILSYMLAARGGPLWDAQLQQWDLALGLDWRGYLGFMNAHPAIARPLQFAYDNLLAQMLGVVIALSFAGRVRELRTAVAAMILSGMIAISISGLTPALSNFVFLGLSPADYPNLHPSAAFVHVEHLEALRAGVLRQIALEEMQGIVTFPSYHAALATVFLWGFAHVPWLRWPGMAFALATLLATPVDGGHYFVDVFAGVAIAGLSIAACRHAVLARAFLRAIRSSPFRRSRGASVQ